MVSCKYKYQSEFLKGTTCKANCGKNSQYCFIHTTELEPKQKVSHKEFHKFIKQHDGILEGAIFEELDIRDLIFNVSVKIVYNGNFRKADISDSNWAYVKIYCTDFSNAVLKGWNLEGGLIKDCIFKEAILEEAYLKKVIIYNVDFSGLNLKGINLDGAMLKNVKFDNCILDEAILDDIVAMNVSFKGASLKGATLEGASLNRADLSGADLSDADLSEANLYKALLFKTKINSNTNFTDAEVKTADFRDVFLEAVLDVVDTPELEL